MTLTDGTVSGARASFVSVTDIPSVLDLDPHLRGVEPGSGQWDDALDAVAEAVQAHVEPESDIHASAEYRRMLAGELTRRALTQAAHHAHSTQGDLPRTGQSTEGEGERDD